jgi:transcriptional regulator with XRE-family HTH domain
MIDKRDRSSGFRDRLSAAMTLQGMSQSGLARETGVDRSTISALLGPGTRLPNAQLAADCAVALGVTCDWLLGLSDQPEPLAGLLAQAMTITEAPRALFDDAIYAWHRAASGYKIRHVPATLPDMLKTRATVDWEYRDTLGASADEAIAAFQTQLDWLKGARSDYEIALPLHEVACFAEGSGYWAGLPAQTRRDQMDHLINLCEALYPSLRLYLFDAHRVYSAPVTIFGPHRAVVYLGRHYLSFQEQGTVMTLSQHFDWLVREATSSARTVTDHLAQLRDRIRVDQ